MAQLREPAKTADLSLVRELDEEALRPARRRLLEGLPWATPEVVEQIFRAKALIGERVTTRFFGVELDGTVVSYADLYVDGADAQVEDVGTLPEQRGKGLRHRGRARGRSSKRGPRARTSSSSSPTPNDWPKELYRRLGFDELGHYTKFFAPSP